MAHPYDNQTANMEYIQDREPLREISDAPSAAPTPDTVNKYIAMFTEGANKLLSLLSSLLASFLILYSGYALYDTFYTQETARNSWDLLKENISVQDGTSLADAIAAINGDYRCWLTVYDTKIDYPVLQGEDDLYYADHDIYGNTSLTGAIYLAAGNSGDLSDNYNLIYGHHMSDSIMFGALDAFEEAAYFNSHHEGEIITGEKVYDLYIFAVIDTDAYENMVYTAGNRNLEELLAYIRANAIQFEEPEAGSDKYVALSTCRDATTSGRLVVFATMTERCLLNLTVEDYDEVYDGETHSALAQVNLPEGTTLKYSTDGGQTWTTEPPGVKDVMRDADGSVSSLTVTVRAFNPQYGSDEKTLTMTVRPKPVTVTADPKEKFFGEPNPTLTAVVDGTLGSDTVAYTLSREEGEGVGTYTISPTGEAQQGNYVISYETAVFTIKPVPGMTLAANGYEGTYDGNTHSVTASVSEPGATIEYSTDGGQTWTTTAPGIRDVIRKEDGSAGEIEVIVRATKENYATATKTVTLKVNPASVTVTAENKNKTYGTVDPTLTASVSGTLGSDTVAYTLSREEGEGVGTYTISPAGEAQQGNYNVSFVPGTLTIAPAGGLTLTAQGYEGTYDGNTHAVTASASQPNSTVEYSTDGGQTWTTTAPGIRDVIRNADNSVGEMNVLVRVSNPNYTSPAVQSVTLKINPASVTVTADDKVKRYGEADPVLTATVSGVLPGESVNYNVTRAEGSAIGSYAITPSGEAQQGNYSVSYIPGILTITPLGNLTLAATGYNGVYDGTSHTASGTANIPEAVVEYSLNGGTWTTTPPGRVDVGTDTVRVRARLEGYETVQTTVKLTVTYRPVTVTVRSYTKRSGTADPAFSATVTGRIGSDPIAYTISRIGGEAVGSYPIYASGEQIQGNYIVTYVAGTLTITSAGGGGGGTVTPPSSSPTPSPAPSASPSPSASPAPSPSPTPTPEPEESEAPQTLAEVFQPTGGTHGDRAWALVNLICLLVTVYLLVPLLHLKAKYGRLKNMKALNEEKCGLCGLADPDEQQRRERDRILDDAVEEKRRNGEAAGPADITEDDFAGAVERLYYRVKEFARRFRCGFALEVIDVIAAVVAFILTEDMRLPMILIDKWTPLMLLLLLICWIVDVRLMRYRDKPAAFEEDGGAQPAGSAP